MADKDTEMVKETTEEKTSLMTQKYLLKNLTTQLFIHLFFGGENETYLKVETKL